MVSKMLEKIFRKFKKQPYYDTASKNRLTYNALKELEEYYLKKMEDKK